MKPSKHGACESTKGNTYKPSPSSASKSQTNQHANKTTSTMHLHRMQKQSSQPRPMHTTPTQTMAKPISTHKSQKPTSHRMEPHTQPPTQTRTKLPKMQPQRHKRRPHHTSRSKRGIPRHQQHTNPLRPMQNHQRPRRPKELPPDIPLRGGAFRKFKGVCQKRAAETLFRASEVFRV